MLLVASSRIKILDRSFRSKARARPKSWNWPCDRGESLSGAPRGSTSFLAVDVDAPFAVSSFVIGVAVPEGAAVLLPRDLMTCHSWAFSSAVIILSSGTRPEGSTLSRILSLRTNVSCGIAINLARIFSRGRVRRSRPSSVMEPDSSSIRRRIESSRVDFPLNSEFQYLAKLR